MGQFSAHPVCGTNQPSIVLSAERLGDQDTHILNVISSGFGVSSDGRSLTLTAGDQGFGYRAEG